MKADKNPKIKQKREMPHIFVILLTKTSHTQNGHRTLKIQYFS